MTETKTKTEETPPKKPNTGLKVAAGLAVAGAVGTGVFFLTRSASASSKPKAPKGSGRGSNKGGSNKGGSDKSGGSQGPGGDANRGGGKTQPPKEDRSDPSPQPESEREGYFWGDPGKIPEDFDYGSNKIYVAPDCSSVAVGYWFFAAGTLDGEQTSVPIGKLVDAISNPNDQRVRIPRDAHNGVGRQADLLGILSEHPKRTAFTWVGEYYGKIASAPGHSSTQLAEDMFAQASQRTGGVNCMARRDQWSPQIWDFIGFAASRLDDFRMAAYGPKAFGG